MSFEAWKQHENIGALCSAHERAVACDCLTLHFILAARTYSCTGGKSAPHDARRVPDKHLARFALSEDKTVATSRLQTTSHIRASKTEAELVAARVTNDADSARRRRTSQMLQNRCYLVVWVQLWVQKTDSIWPCILDPKRLALLPGTRPVPSRRRAAPGCPCAGTGSRSR